jgi:hypothetical protein
MVNFGSAVVVHLNTYPKVGGSNLAGDQQGENGKERGKGKSLWGRG